MSIQKVCEHCDEEFMAKRKDTRYCYDKECVADRKRTYEREYLQRPGPKTKKNERNKEYLSDPEVRARTLERQGVYNKQPHVQERHRESQRERMKNMSPEERVKYNEERRLYAQRPEVKARRRVARQDRSRPKNFKKIDQDNKDKAPPVKRLTPEEYERKKSMGQ